MPGNEPIQSLIKGIDVFLHILQCPEGQRLKDISNKMRINPTTIHNLIKSLSLKGFVEKSNNGYFKVGNAFKEIAKQYIVSDFYYRIETEMRDIIPQFKNAILTYSEAINSEISVVLRLTSEMPNIIQRPIFQKFNPYYNVSGLIHLAFGEDETTALLKFAHPFLEEGLKYWKNEKVLNNYLRKVKKLGYAKSLFTEKNVLRVAVPIFSANDQFRGCLGLSIRLPSEKNLNHLEEKYLQILINSSKKIKEECNKNEK